MEPFYKDLFFDLDRTLWDFDKNSQECLHELFEEFDLAKLLNTESAEFSRIWAKANFEVWAQYKGGWKTKEEIRLARFKISFDHFNYRNFQMVEEISQAYIQSCPFKTNLLPNALETLTYLHKKYKLHLITNGFAESQKIKLQHSGLSDFFNAINISDEMDCRKPQRLMFKRSLENAGAEAKTSVMIGDDLMKDIVGAKKVNMAQVHFNPEKKNQGKIVPTHTIEDLKQLQEIL